jgi:ubiquinone/menaquinone biosynthesis C-methylase UbiE
MREYYDARAEEYDDWYLSKGLLERVERPGWAEDLQALEDTISQLPEAKTLDVACGTGFLTRHLHGQVTALDQSEKMLEIARRRLTCARIVRADALSLPFPDNAFDRVFTAHFYGHLEEPSREAFVREARRVAPELVIVDAALPPHGQPVRRERRILSDGSEFQVYKRYFDGDDLVSEFGGGTVIQRSRWFVVVSVGRGSRGSR